MMPENTTGDLSYTFPPPWTIKITDGGVAIIPRRNYVLYSISTVILLSIFGGALSHFLDNYLFIVFTGIVSVVLVGVMYITQRTELKRGPWLIWHKDNGNMELPRIEQIFDFRDVVAFQQVTGRGAFGGKPVTELNILVKKHDRPIERFQLIGSEAKSTIEKISIPLSKTTKIKLYRLKENSNGQIIKRDTFDPIKESVV